MDNVAFVALSRQLNLQSDLDITANNLANLDTAGFKVENLIVNAYPAKPSKTDQILTPTAFSLDTAVGRDFTQGSLSRTGNDYDLAIEGAGVFFKVQTAKGERYTRDGRFTMSPGGTLQTRDGHDVLDDTGKPIQIQPNQGPPSVAPDGTISQNGQKVGKVGLARFASLSPLHKEGNNLLSSPLTTPPLPATDAKVRQGMVEGSNVNPIRQMTHLIEVQRAYERVSKISDANFQLSRDSVKRLGAVS